MAPRRGAQVVEEVQHGQLAFNEPLSWKAGKPIPTSELLKRLDALSTELREMDQDEADTKSLHGVAKELAGHNLINHKDKGVRAFTACCLVDVLKICAPHAPFTPSQLKDIFTLFITFILPALSDPSNVYNIQHKYVLVTLAEVKSIVLLTDIPNHEDLLLHVFDNCFDIISGSAKSSTGESISKDVEYNMTQILVTLVDESQSLPGEVVESIMAQFLRVSRPGSRKEGKDVDEGQSTLLLKELPEAYNMAKTICNSCPENMARYVSQYFNDVIMEVTGADTKTNGHRKAGDGGAESEDDERPSGPTEAGMQELHKAHDLLRELWRASPAVLQNVIPQLEAELSAENVGLRLLATETLGDIISGIGAAGPPPPAVMDAATFPPVKLEDYPLGPVSDSILTTPSSPQSFAQTHSTVYNSFMSRYKDKSPVVRAGWTTAVGRIIVTSAGGIGLSRDEESGLIRGLNEKLNDGDDRVRLAAVKVIGGFGFRDIMTRLVPNGHLSKSGSILSSFADRVRDRKHAIRIEAMTALGRMWGVATGEILSGNTLVTENLGSIPSRIFDAFYANDQDVNVLLDHVMFEQLIPLSYPPTKSKKAANGDAQSNTNGTSAIDADKLRTERILLLVKSLDPKSSKAFFAMQARQPQYAKVMEAFLKLCEENNGGVNDKENNVKNKLEACIRWFADKLPDPLRITQDLNKYAKLHDRRSYQLLRFAMAAENDFNTVHKAIKEFRKRLGAKDSPAGILDTFNPIIYRSSSLIYNISHQPVILQFSRTDESGLGATANVVMKEISDKHPEIFQASVKELCKAIVDNAPTETKANDPGSVDTLKALASFAKHGNKIPSDRKFIQALKDFALFGVPAKVAKYAVSILTTTERKEMHLKDLLDKSVENWTYGSNHFLTKLATLSQLTLLDLKTTEDASDEILDITTAQLLLKTRTPKSESDPDWQADGEIDPECEAKSWALKTLVNRLRATEDLEAAKKLFVPVYKVLNALIVKHGELSKQNDTPNHHKARLRLLAGQQMLKICTIKMYDDLLSPTEFNRLSTVAQDPLEYVRRGFVEKLQKYIVKGQLSNRFLTIIFLTTFEPSTSFRNSIMTWIRSRVKLCSDSQNRVFEAVFPRLIHLLAHHPDFTDVPDELVDNARYLLYYLTTVSSESNLGHIYKYAERVKQTRDALPGSDSDRLYLLSDLAQLLIRKWQDKKGWNLQTWPAKVGMPVGLFAGLPSHEVAQEIAEKNYLPDEMDDLLEELVRKSESKKQKRKSEHDDTNPSKKQKSERTPRANGPKKERVIKPAREKKSPKPKKSRNFEDEFDSPAPSSAAVERRRSGRGVSVSAKKVYADRDSDEDDEEMLKGVAQWEYVDLKDGGRRKSRIEKDETLVKDDDEEEEGEEDADEEVDKQEDEEKEEEEVIEEPKAKVKPRGRKRKAPSEEAEPEFEKEDSPLSDPKPEAEEDVEEEVEEAEAPLEKSDSPLSPEPEQAEEAEDVDMPDAGDEDEEVVMPSSPPKSSRTRGRNSSALTSSSAKTATPKPSLKAKAKAPIVKAALKGKVGKAKETAPTRSSGRVKAK